MLNATKLNSTYKQSLRLVDIRISNITKDNCQPLGHLLRLTVVHFPWTCLGTEIFLHGLTLSSTLSSNPKSSSFVDLEFPHKLLLYLHLFHDNFFHCETTRMNEDAGLCYPKGPISIN